MDKITKWKKFMWCNFTQYKTLILCDNVPTQIKSLINAMAAHKMHFEGGKLLAETKKYALNYKTVLINAKGEIVGTASNIDTYIKQGYTIVRWTDYSDYEKYKPTTQNETKINATAFSKNIQKMLKTFVIKNTNYGNSFESSLEKYGLIAGLTRLSDKFNRLETIILTKQNGTSDETLADTLIDLANYAIMLKMYVEASDENQ